MSKKVFIIPGHGGIDGGAAKYIVEKEYTLKTALAMTEFLSEYGIDYKLSRTQDINTNMDEYIQNCNAYKPDLVISVHFNAGGGQGFEIYHSVVGGTSKKLAENINSEVSKLLKSRGIKTKKLDNGQDYFAVIRETDAPAVLVEGGFVDNKSDADFIKSNYKKLAEAYADGIAKTLGISVKTVSAGTASGTSAKPSVKQLYRVRKTWSDSKSQIGAYKSLDNAKKACKTGYAVFDSNGKQVYPTKKSIDEIAKEVIAGKWGNGSERKSKLEAAGYDYTAVQARVNKMMK